MHTFRLQSDLNNVNCNPTGTNQGIGLMSIVGCWWLVVGGWLLVVNHSPMSPLSPAPLLPCSPSPTLPTFPILKISGLKYLTQP
jgi:hypothetical protein